MPRQLDPAVAGEWWWEGNVQDRIRDLLVWEGWTDVEVADAATQERGVDVAATMGDRHLAVEVEGYPSTAYANGRMTGKPKPTAATNQARQWFSRALLSALTMRQALPRTEIAIGLPDVQRYRSLIAATDDSLVILGIGVILVREDGTASWYIRPDRRRGDDDRADIRRAVRMADAEREAYYVESNRNMLRMLDEARGGSTVPITGDPLAFDPLALIRELNAHDVAFVVIGGIAAGVQGAMWATFDLDLTYQRDPANHRRLAAALAMLEADPVDPSAGATVRLDEEALAAADTWRLSTRFGRLDLLATPAPGLDYAELAQRAKTIQGEQVYRVASLPDLVTMKLSVGRPRDRAHVDLLRATQDELALEREPSADSGQP